MARWRIRFTRRREGEGGTAFVGIFVAGLFVVLGGVCLVLDEIPIDTDLRWSLRFDGLRKNLFAFCFLCIAALHFGSVWARVERLRAVGLVGAFAAAAAAGACFLATML